MVSVDGFRKLHHTDPINLLTADRGFDLQYVTIPFKEKIKSFINMKYNEFKKTHS